MNLEFSAHEQALYSVDFNSGLDLWSGGFADYPVGSQLDYSLEWGWGLLPAPFSGHGFHLGGTNRSDDLFMFMKRRITGLLPDSEYLFGVEIQFATNAPEGCAGTGGAPGESVYLKAGVSIEEPLPIQVEGSWRMNIDKGTQGVGGKNALVIGNVANSSRQCADTPYEMKTVTGVPLPDVVKTSTDGAVWLMIGTDSGFESMTSLYYVGVRLFGQFIPSVQSSKTPNDQ